MDTITTQTPAVAAEPCASCGAQVAGDQRYCLNCGARRGDARVPFMEILGGKAPAPVPVAAAGAVERTPSQRNLTIVASIGCLLLALGVGVLIGHGGRDTTPASSSPAQVISVQGSGSGAAAAPAATTGAGAKKASKAKKGGSGSAASAGASHATNKTIKNLDKLSPEQYQKQSQKLPKTVGTGGKAPPKDNKAPAGGGSFQDFG